MAALPPPKPFKKEITICYSECSENRRTCEELSEAKSLTHFSEIIGFYQTLLIFCMSNIQKIWNATL